MLRKARQDFPPWGIKKKTFTSTAIRRRAEMANPEAVLNDYQCLYHAPQSTELGIFLK